MFNDIYQKFNRYLSDLVGISQCAIIILSFSDVSLCVESPRAGFTKGLSLNLELKLRLLSLIHANSMVLDLAIFTKQQNLSYG